MASQVGASLNRKMGKAVTELKRAERTAVSRGALALKRGVEHRPEFPSSRRLKGVGKRGARVGVRFDMKSDTRAEVKATGPMHLIERDTKAHTVSPKGRRGKQGRTGVRLADGQVRRVVNHPGTKGKHVFEKGVEDGRPAALRAMADPIGDAVKRGLRG